MVGRRAPGEHLPQEAEIAGERGAAATRDPAPRKLLWENNIQKHLLVRCKLRPLASRRTLCGPRAGPREIMLRRGCGAFDERGRLTLPREPDRLVECRFRGKF